MPSKKNDSDGPRFNRRNFLNLFSSLGAGAALQANPLEALADVVPHSHETWKQHQVIPSICNMCVNKCGILVSVDNGKITKIDGDPKNPKSRGGTCAKGQAGIMSTYNPDRIKHPMIRVGERGEGKWRKASWDEANAYIAENLVKVIKEHGPESIMWSSTTDLTEKLFVKLGTYIGTPNFARHASLCLSSRNVGYFATMGGVPDSDLANSKYILMFGANRLESFELPYNIDLIEGVKNGAKLVVVDPRLTNTAAKGQWIPIRPKTDLALVLALMNVLINEKLYDKEFVAKRTVGFDKLKQHVQKYTPEWAAKETEVSVKQIKTMAREMAQAAPAVTVFPGRRSSWYTNDSQFRRSMGMLNGLLGAFDAPGSNYFNAGKPKLGSIDWELEPFDTAKRFDDFEEHFPLAHHGDGGYVSMRDAIVNDKAKYPVKAWMVYHQNPVAGVLEQRKTEAMIKKMDFICAIDIQPSQTAWMADVILPEATYLERLDPVFSSRGDRRYVGIRQPVIKPMYESRQLLDIIKGLAKELDKRHEFDSKLSEAFDFTMEEYVDAQLAKLPIDRKTLMKEGIWIDPTDGEHEFGAYRSGKKTFSTPSGKIELVSERFRRNGYPSLPEYEPVIDEAGKLRLLTGHMVYFTHSANQNNQWLNSFYPENEVWINPEDAKKREITNGQYVKVNSVAGEVRIKALVTPKMRKNTVFIVHGFGSDSGGHSVSGGKGGADQVLMKSAADTVSNNQAMHETFVDIVAA